MMISPWSNRPVDVDPFGPNPALEAIRVENPHVVDAALRGGPAPTMFVGGDLPAFLASGLDPAVLNSFPWQMRHGVAAEPNPSTVYNWLQQFAEDNAYNLEHSGHHDFMSRLQTWARTSGTKKTPTVEELEDTYSSLFGGQEAS